jgi:hypothetical protein
VERLGKLYDDRMIDDYSLFVCEIFRVGEMPVD